MISTLVSSFKIDMTYTINAFIYRLLHLPYFKEVFSTDLYKSKKAKKFVRILAIFCTLFRMFITKISYVFFIYFLIQILYSNVTSSLFFHVFFFLSMIGMFINTRILSVGRKKYYAVILMGMDAKKYTLAYYWFYTITNFITNLVALFILSMSLLSFGPLYAFIFALITVCLKTSGEVLNILFYQKTETLLVARNNYYFTILITFLLLAFLLPYIHMILPPSSYFLLSVVIFIFSLFSLVYLYHFNSYQKIYKKINTEKAIRSEENETAYQRQMALEIRKKDYKINEKKLKGKRGYDYFNTIFFLRHKVILSSSANLFSFVCFLLFGILILYALLNKEIQPEIYALIHHHFAIILIVMYFVNRGSIITQAMFYNCDRSMLTFNFYREKEVILNVFKQRLKTVSMVNLRPAFVIGLGLSILLILCSHSFSIHYLFMFLSVLMLSVFFSLHYLVIYYLLQPYNEYMEIKSFSYTIVSFFTYFLCYLAKDLTFSFPVFSILILIGTIIYIILALFLVYKFSEETFKLK